MNTKADTCYYTRSTVELIEMKSSGSRDWRPGNADRVLYAIMIKEEEPNITVNDIPERKTY